jgi:hypothetical protein
LRRQAYPNQPKAPKHWVLNPPWREKGNTYV